MTANREQMSLPQQEACSLKMLEENYETICWGCGLRLLLPSYAPVYKCGWCGAITNNTVKQHIRHWFDCFHAFGNRFIVLIVVCIILSIICGGVWAVYPVVFSTVRLSSVFHSICTLILASGTLASYFLAAFQPAGPPPIISWGNYEVVGKGGLDNYSFCQFCMKPKSEQTHHCSSCKTCVLNMDHHCPFIGNCVGATNHHHFITFLFFALVSNIYVLFMSVYAGISVWPTLAYVPIDPVFAVRSANVLNIVKAFLHALMRSSVVLSARAVALIYLIVASISVAVGIGLLFFQQVQLLYSGKTYIDTLKYRSNVSVETLPLSRGWGNLFRIFGSGHPIFWLLPKKKSSTSSMKSH